MTPQKDHRTAFGDIIQIVLNDIIKRYSDEAYIACLLLEVRDNNGRRHIFTLEEKDKDVVETYRNLDIFSKEITTTSKTGGK